MDKTTKYNFFIILVAFLACITLGGLGNIAAQEHFYWTAFVANIAVYGYFIYKLIKEGKRNDPE